SCLSLSAAGISARTAELGVDEDASLRMLLLTPGLSFVSGLLTPSPLASFSFVSDSSLTNPAPTLAAAGLGDRFSSLLQAGLVGCRRSLSDTLGIRIDRSADARACSCARATT